MNINALTKYFALALAAALVSAGLTGITTDAQAQQQQPPQQEQPQPEQQQQPQQQQAPAETDGESVVDVINETGDHEIFASLLEEAQLAETLEQPGSFTILAPNDEAFEEMGEELDQLRAEPQMVQSLLMEHVFQGEADAAEVEEQLGVEVANGDNESDNGVVHEIDEVLDFAAAQQPQPEQQQQQPQPEQQPEQPQPEQQQPSPGQ
jgi:uncharacterized surface protein with fasciclin (FAS1) repeats